MRSLRSLVVVVLALLVLVLFPALARAEDETCPQLAPAPPHASVVRVEAREHVGLGVVVGAPDLVVVRYRTVEVDAAFGPHAYVIDSTGRSTPASLVAVDARRRVALLRAGRPVGPALALRREEEEPLRACSFVVGEGWDLGTTDFTTFRWVRFRSLPRFAPARAVTRLPATGSAMVDTAGRVVGLVTDDEEIVTASELDALLTRPADGATLGTAGRRAVIGYGGIALSTFEVGGGSVWWGGRGHVAARYRDLLETRLELGLSFLMPHHRDGDECGEPPCFAGGRFTATPSVGLHLRVASLEHHLAVPVALKPSVGVALVLQEVTDARRATTFDQAAPRAWWTLAPGLALTLGYAEIGMRVRVPRAEVRAPTWEIAAGFAF